MDQHLWIAERTIYAIAADGIGVEVQLAIGRPYQVSQDEWACPVRVDGLHNNLKDMHGVDSWQALQLAYQLAGRLLEGFVQEGGRLLWEKDGEPIQSAELFPNVSTF